MKNILSMFMALIVMGLVTVHCGGGSCYDPNLNDDPSDPTSQSCLSLIEEEGVESTEEQAAAVGDFTSSLSGETETVQNLDFAQMTTLCEEVAAYNTAKGLEVADTLSSCAPPDMPAEGDEMSMEVDPSDAADQAVDCNTVEYVNCDATVEELLPCITAQADAANAVILGFAAALAGCTDAISAAAAIEAPPVECEDVQSRCAELFANGSVVSMEEAGEDHDGDEHEGEDHEGEDHEGEDHDGEDHDGEDHDGEGDA